MKLVPCIRRSHFSVAYTNKSGINVFLGFLLPEKFNSSVCVRMTLSIELGSYVVNGNICFAGEMSKSSPPPSLEVSTHAPRITMLKVMLVVSDAQEIRYIVVLNTLSLLLKKKPPKFAQIVTGLQLTQPPLPIYHRP